MQDFSDRYGSPSSERIYQNESSREGQPFDDSHLIEKKYKLDVSDYEWPDGSLAYQQCRYDDDNPRPGVDERKKKFLPRRPKDPEKFNQSRSAHGKLHWKPPNSEYVFGPGERRVIFNWPAIWHASLECPVFVCQGEKNAKDIMRHNKYLLATTVISAKWTPECVGALAGRDLFVIEDHDESGRKEAERVHALLLKVAKTVRIVTATHLWKYLPPEKGNPAPTSDVSDWLEAGGDATKLMRICYEVPAEGEIKAEPHTFPKAEDIAPWDFLYGWHLLRGTVSVTAGSGETGKTTKSIAEALAMAGDKSLLGVKPPNGPLRVLLVNLEDDRNTMDKRIAAAMKLHGLTPLDVGDRLITIAKGEYKLKIATQTRQGVIEPNEAAVKNLTQFLIERKIDVLSIDPLRRTHRVNENDNVAMGEVIELYEDIAEEAYCAIHLWHHMRKGNGGEVNTESIRGAVTIVDSARSCEVVEKMTKDEAKKMNIEPDKRRFYFNSYNGKLNFAPPIEQRFWFKLESVDLQNAFPGDNVGVVAMWQPPSTRNVTLSPGDIEQIKQTVGTELRWRKDLRAGMWVGEAVAKVMGLSAKDDRKLLADLVEKLLMMGALKTQEGKDGARRDRLFVVACSSS